MGDDFIAAALRVAIDVMRDAQYADLDAATAAAIAAFLDAMQKSGDLSVKSARLLHVLAEAVRNATAVERAAGREGET